jgi:hypothetical protein
MQLLYEVTDVAPDPVVTGPPVLVAPFVLVSTYDSSSYNFSKYYNSAFNSIRIENPIFLSYVQAYNRYLVPDSLVPGNPYNLWISIGVNDKNMDTFESQNSIIGETSV